MLEIEAFISFISEKVTLTNEDIEKLKDLITLEHFDKGTFILNQGQVCNKLRFVYSGIYRVYQINEGKEITSYFNFEHRNRLVGAFVSLLTSQPSEEYIECISPGTLVTVNYYDWEALYTISPALNTFGRLLAEFNYILAIERIASLQYKNATNRYEAFIEQYPGLFNRIPHHYIASYLGITPESLSRIRKSLKNA